MKIFNLLMILSLTVMATNVMAYGSSSSKKACKKPTFKNFTPAHLATVEPNTEFSFLASGSTNPDSITVSIKKQTVDVEIKKTNNGYLVTGTLPESLQSTYARIVIKAAGTNKCKGNDGWLLNIK